jgi:hypothetical protein
MTTPRKPAWWQLYALVPVLGGLFMLDHRAALPPDWHKAVQAAIILVIYGLVWRWLRANTYALMTGPTRYHRHGYNGYDIDAWAHATKVDRAACRQPAPCFISRLVAGQPARARHPQQCVHPSAHGTERWTCSPN